jgi:WS/DGAT/MGAT family acyltransferase
MQAARRRRIDPVDLILLKQEADPRRASAVTLVIELEHAPDFDDLLARIDAATLIAPILRERLVHPWGPLGPPEWAPDPDFDVRRHVRRAVLPESGLTGFVEAANAAPLDASRPLWEATLLEGSTPALVTRMSHVLGDGLKGMTLLAALFDADRAAPAPPAPSNPRPPLLELGLTTARAGVGLARDPARGLRYASSLLRVVNSGGSTGSPALSPRGSGRHYVGLSVPFPALRRGAKAAGGSLNDGYLAAVMGGLRHYHERLGVPVEQVPFAIPISTRARGGSGESGNRFAPLRFAAPIGVADPAERIRRVTQIVAAGRSEPALDALTAFAPAIAPLPSFVIGLAGVAQDRLDAQASYVPGPPIPVRLAGSAVLALRAYGPLPGPAIMAIMLTYGGRAEVGFTVDAAAVPDPHVFHDAMRRGFDEVIALGI